MLNRLLYIIVGDFFFITVIIFNIYIKLTFLAMTIHQKHFENEKLSFKSIFKSSL